MRRGTSESGKQTKWRNFHFVDVFPFIFVHRNYLEFSGLDRETDRHWQDGWMVHSSLGRLDGWLNGKEWRSVKRNSCHDFKWNDYRWLPFRNLRISHINFPKWMRAVQSDLCDDDDDVCLVQLIMEKILPYGGELLVDMRHLWHVSLPDRWTLERLTAAMTAWCTRTKFWSKKNLDEIMS